MARSGLADALGGAAPSGCATPFADEEGEHLPSARYVKLGAFLECYI